MNKPVLIAAVSAGPPEKTPVIVGFKEKPDPDLIRAYGGEIKYEYHIIPAITASLPEKAIDTLKRNPNIEHIEPDYEVTIAAEVLPWGIDRIDTSIDYTHPDLANNVKGGVSFVDLEI